jgi:hypothetical protein
MTTQAQPSPSRPSRLALAIYQRRSDSAIRTNLQDRLGVRSDELAPRPG